jgi:hypothetical protein
MRTDRSRTSGENFTDFFMWPQFSQGLEPPRKPGRFNKVTARVVSHASHAMVPEQPKAVADIIVDWVGSLAP